MARYDLLSGKRYSVAAGPPLFRSGALKVSPHDAHRHVVSFVISLASVPTFVELHAEQTGRAVSSYDIVLLGDWPPIPSVLN